MMVAALVLLVGQGCQPFNKDIMDDLELSVDMNIIKTNITVRFLDATTDMLIGEEDGSQVDITVHGPDSAFVVTSMGSYQNQFTTGGGFLSIGLDPYKAKPTLADPVEITLVAQLEGYISTSLPITLVSEGGHTFIVRMVNEEAPPEGVVVEKQEDVGEAENGTLEEDIKFQTENNEVDITLEQGTVLKDEEGEPLEGDLDIKVAHFNPTEEEALGSFPGGMDVSVSNESGIEESGAFVSAGFVAIDITDQDGNKAALFEGEGLKLDTEIDPNIINPETGQPVKDGDIIPFWSYDEKTGEWTFEKNIEIKQTPMGLRTEAQLMHLSWWNIDWFERACEFAEFFFTSTDLTKTGPDGLGYGFKWTATLVGGDGTYQTNGYSAGFPEAPATMTTYNTERVLSVPLDRQVLITFNPGGESDPNWVTPDPITIDCQNGPFEVPLTPKSGGVGGGGDDFLIITFNVTINCTNLGTQANIPDNTLLRFRKKGSLQWIYVQAQGSTVTIAGIEQNQVYEVQALYNNQWIPNPPFEYYVEPSDQLVLTKYLVFDLEC